MGLDSALVSAVGAVPAGVVVPFAGATSPSGWLLCHGQAVSRTDYGALFTAIGTTYGTGDGSTTFNLPDLRGRVVAGLDNMGGSAASRLTSTTITGGADGLGEVGGGQTNTHNHFQSVGYDGTNFYAKNFALQPRSGVITVDRAAISGTQSNAAARLDSTDHEVIGVVQPTMVLNYIIKASAY